MTVVAASLLDDLLADVVGRPVTVEVLKHKPGRRITVRATGPAGPVIAKAYASQRAPTVATRVAALADGPTEPALPRLLLVDAANRVVILTEVPGIPLAEAITAGRHDDCRRAGAALGRWHRHWHGRPPPPLDRHTVERELDILNRRAATAPPVIAAAVRDRTPRLATPWPCSTAIHRDLYEQQIIIDHTIGLIDLDDASSGPPELDVANLLAHLDAHLHLHRVDAAIDAILDGYYTTGPPLDPERLRQCEQLSRLRLACIHAEPALLAPGSRRKDEE